MCLQAPNLTDKLPTMMFFFAERVRNKSTEKIQDQASEAANKFLYIKLYKFGFLKGRRALF